MLRKIANAVSGFIMKCLAALFTSCSCFQRKSWRQDESTRSENEQGLSNNARVQQNFGLLEAETPPPTPTRPPTINVFLANTANRSGLMAPNNSPTIANSTLNMDYEDHLTNSAPAA